ncbi:exo-beta-1,3-glucanase [Guyanagaster necrorhizus]|uniref:Exo-beta-1,3-glucanase n=1 Tax=Guyanagaster necrorhizus TaxID=856835 RepID=A0A9P7W5K4_9AGAR|nr:exo-beta-1,3-glucanase [Guyanagaster necrorhizus MCA 3950]KAG7453017.1 exo-beta-1,3-glucanase [Guyanagaster necrorhizus MCA 3950]
MTPSKSAVSANENLTGEPFWLEAIKHQGTSPFNPDPASYQVFRNVKDFGAVGDGKHDDSRAINRAISHGKRCGGGKCRSSTTTRAIVYFPAGTYLVSKSIISYYATQLIGDPKNPPTLLASNSFNDMAVIDVNPYIPGGNGAQWYTPTNNFFRSVRNFVIDVTQVPAEKSQGTGIHWQVGQATSLFNIKFVMSSAPNTAHQGIWMENGSGGLMSDLEFNGGKYGMWVGNQQFTVRNVVFNGVNTAIFAIWNWGWTFQGVTINNCQVGFDLLTGGKSLDTQTVGAEVIIDAKVRATGTFVRSSVASNGSLTGSLVLQNIQLSNVPVAVGTGDGAIVLPGAHLGIRTIQSWGQGNVYTGSNSSGRFIQGVIEAPSMPASLLDRDGKVIGRVHPQYEDIPVNKFVSVKDHGAKGDGRTNDTLAIQSVLNKYYDSKVIFFDAGVYIITSTVTIPAGCRMVGEAWSEISGKGDYFKDVKNPKVMVRVGQPGSRGSVEITDIVFSTTGPAPGAIVLEWNVRGYDNNLAGPGMWDSHIILGGSEGSGMDSAHCPEGSEAISCSPAFLGLHLTSEATAVLEGTWVWLADHDLDKEGEARVTLFSSRGILSESRGPVWMVGTGSEHHSLYQYNLVNASNHYLGLIQTETPYYQPVPPAPGPFGIHVNYNDPIFRSDITSAWGLRIESSNNIFIFGAGLYSFFNNYSQSCLTTVSCQPQIADISSDSEVYISSLSTVGATYQVSVDQTPVVHHGGNANGFAQTVTYWSSN